MISMCKDPLMIALNHQSPSKWMNKHEQTKGCLYYSRSILVVGHCSMGVHLALALSINSIDIMRQYSLLTLLTSNIRCHFSGGVSTILISDLSFLGLDYIPRQRTCF